MPKLWVEHQTAVRTFGPIIVSTDGCEYVHDLKFALRRIPQLAIPLNTPIILYHSDGATQIDAEESITDFAQGNSRKNPIVVKTVTSSIVMDFPSFDPSNYSPELPFFENKESDNHIEILGRDDVIEEINSIMHDRLKMDKYRPVIISSSRGMGKSFLLKKYGMQQIKDHLKIPLVGNAITSGRILSFDFALNPSAIQTDGDVLSFFPRLMIYFLCRLFNGTQVGGINFKEIKSFYDVATVSGQQAKFNEWLVKWRRSNCERMIDEYIRLTNIAFGIEDNTPPVFLLDEIQKLCFPTSAQSKFAADGSTQYHSQLSLLLIQLATRLKPVCICTGTNNGNIKSIVGSFVIIPSVLSLRPLVSEYREFWKQLTAYSNQNSSPVPQVKMDSDENLINALAYASYHIPRLLFIAHSVWFDLRKNGNTNSTEFYIQAFEQKAIIYYGEMVTILNQYTTETIAHILLACGVHWIVYNEASNVPGTEIRWDTLIQRSIVFPYVDGCYIFPFSLVWRVATTETGTKDKKKEIETRCSELIPNLDVNDLYWSYDMLCNWENYNLGVRYETMFASSLAVKYYLRSIVTRNKGYSRFTTIYDISSSELPAFNIMNKYEVNFAKGISFPTSEVFTKTADLECAVVHNKTIHNAHHDIILPARTSLGTVNIAVQAKASFEISNQKPMSKHLLVSPNGSEQVEQLFWLYLGEEQREEKLDSIAFLDGSGCCNGLALDFFILLKKLKSQNQK